MIEKVVGFQFVGFVVFLLRAQPLKSFVEVNPSHLAKRDGVGVALYA